MILFLPLLFALSSAHASTWTGIWKGTGEAIFSPNAHRYPCSEIALSLKEDADRLELRSGDYICGELQAAYDPTVFTIRDGKLFEGENAVGDIGENSISIAYVDAEEGFTYSLRLEKTGGKAKFTERWLEGSQERLQVSGELTSP